MVDDPRRADARPFRRHADVAVVGAGIAGLTAARDLVRAGRSVVVLEARDRVGGRMFRRSLGDGTHIDLGGQWVGPTQDRIIALADDLGVRRFPTYLDGRTTLVYRGARGEFDGDFPPFKGEAPPVPAGEVDDARQALAKLDELSALVPPEAPWTAPNAEALDSQTLSTWLDDNTSSEFARFTITLQARIGGSGAFEPGQASLLHYLFTNRSSPQREVPESELFVGGAGLVALTLADQLGDRVVLGSPVRSVDHGADGVVLTSPAGSVQAAHTIVAIPPTLAGQILYDPPLPPLRTQLTQRVAMGSLAGIHSVYPTAFWRGEGLSGLASGDLPTLEFTADASPPGGRPGVLRSFVAGNRVISWGRRSAPERREAVLADLVSYFGPRASSPVEYVEMDWTAEPWTGGAFTAFMPPGVWSGFGPALRAPVGRIHWAGTETALRWNGYFDGAVRSGEDAAAAVLEEL